MNPIEIGNRIRSARTAASLTLRELSARTGVDIGTISRMENGMIGKNREVLNGVLGELGVSLSEKDGGIESNLLTIGYPANLWSSPLILLSQSKDLGYAQDMYCSRNSNELIDSSSTLDFDAHDIYTARELVNNLESSKFTMAFLPPDTAKDLSGSYIRIGRIMHTAKCGCTLLAIKKEKNFKSVTVSEIDKLAESPQKLCVVYPEETLAEGVYRYYFQKFDNIEKANINVINKTKMKSDIESILEKSFRANVEMVLFIGWDFNIFNLKKILGSSATSKYSCCELDSYLLSVGSNDQMTNHSLDFVTKIANLDNIKFLAELQQFLDALIRQTNKLNDHKSDHRSLTLKPILDFLGLKGDDETNGTQYDWGYGYLRKIDFEVMLYPAFINHLLNNQTK
ncbi:MAG: Helix-turn-helix domain [Bacteroidetes bacterium]|nr:Helix-turn-helix domain [Bacteroidota bacterium]